MHKIDVTITGVSPLLMHRFPLASADGFEKWPEAKQAEWAAYRDEAGGLYVPAGNLYRALISAATYAKGKGRGNLSRVVAGSLLVVPDHLTLGTQEYAIDTRIVMNPVTKGRHPRVRPRLDTWCVSFSLEADETLLTAKQIREIVDICGARIGLLDYRPEKKGPFGRFMVTAWREAE